MGAATYSPPFWNPSHQEEKLKGEVDDRTRALEEANAALQRAEEAHLQAQV